MKVYILIWNFSIGGAQKHTILLGNALIESGFEVTFLAVKCSGPMIELLSPQVKVEEFHIQKTNSLRGLRELCQNLKSKIPLGASIIANGPNNFRQIARINILTRRWRLIYILHNDLDIKKSLFSRLKVMEMSTLLNQKFLKLVALSPDQKAKHERIYGIKKIHLIPNFVSEHVSNGKKTRPEPIALCLGRLSKEKGHEQLIEAARLLKDEINIDIYGGGPLKEELVLKRDELGLSNINFYSPVLDVDKILAQYDFLILPSLSETFGMVLIEALNGGVPVVSSACSGPISIVKDRVNGLLVQPGDAQDLARGIQEMNQLVNNGFFDKTKLRDSVSQYHLHNILPKYIEVIKNWQD
ncbi:glycosyltransferase [Roseivirga sp. E12]|uniref:glycosyltransferase n=1 Tax=Roseivirga sp. E12 TaxID=2819237 RepID=UPI001ABC0159|nr:glycosyltransferase [Roseivirga sp. E12]MBO3698365.1 glycosyltransferase [Roseivirga sp. E12]